MKPMQQRALAGAGVFAGLAVAPAGPSQISAARPASLEHIFQAVKLHRVPLNAQDIYQICGTAAHSDGLGLLQDADFMRGLADAFARSNQSVLTPFQCSLVINALRNAGTSASPKEVMVPEADAVSPESLLDVLQAMNVNQARDERKIREVVRLLSPLLDDLTPAQLALAISELGRLRCDNADILARLAKRLVAVHDAVGAQEVALTAKSLALTRGVPQGVLRQVYALVESYIHEFQPEDYLNCLQALTQSGPQYRRVFHTLVEAGLEHVENMDAVTLTHFMTCFTTMEYRGLEQVEIYADALVNVAEELQENDLVQAFGALYRRDLLVREDIFNAMVGCLARRAPALSPRNISLVADVCSRLPHRADALMGALLDRVLECARVLTAYQLGEIVEVIALYPPARDHPVMDALGKQAKLRVELMSSESLGRATRGLATLGYSDVEFYMMAAQTGFRYGFKGWSQLEPIFMGLCLATECPLSVVKVVASHIAPMARTMSMAEIERANRYLVRLRCEEDYVYRALATRVLQFVKEITADTPEELQLLLQKGSRVDYVKGN